MKAALVFKMFEESKNVYVFFYSMIFTDIYLLPSLYI